MKLALLAAVALALATASAVGADDRTTADQPDEQVGPQVHLVYAVPQGGADRGFDTDGTIAHWVNGFNDWFAVQTGGVRIRIDTSQGRPDITFLQLKETSAQIEALDRNAPFQVMSEVTNAGLNDPQKRYLVLYEGADDFGWCGEAIGPGSVVFLDSCDVSDWMEALVGHEMLHFIGAVNDCAPHAAYPGEVGDNPNDLMSFSVPSLATAQLDPGHDDYWGPPGDDHLPAQCAAGANVANSDYLTSHTFYRVQVNAGAGGEISVTLPDGDTQYCEPSAPCTPVVAHGTNVTLSAVPEVGEHFAGWQGACGAASDCTTAVNGPLALTATFAPNPYLALRVVGNGRVTVAGSKQRCARHCSFQLDYAETTTLREVPATGWRFKAWTGLCRGAKKMCRVNLRTQAALTAVFAKKRAR